MATIKITFDKRADHKTKDKKFPLVLRVGHARKTRDIPFNLHLKEISMIFRLERSQES